jgi:transcription antitermination factor NusG
MAIRRGTLKKKQARRRVMLNAADLAWFAVCVGPGDETRSQKILSRLGLWVFVPRYSVWRRPNRYSRFKQERHYPLMPRYLIIGGASPNHVWRSLYRCGRIRGVMCADGKPYRFPIVAVEKLNDRAESGDFCAPQEHRFMRSKAEFGEGDEVLIVDDAYDGVTATVRDIVGPYADVDLEMMGAQRLMRVPLDRLVKSP